MRAQFHIVAFSNITTAGNITKLYSRRCYESAENKQHEQFVGTNKSSRLGVILEIASFIELSNRLGVLNNIAHRHILSYSG